MTAPKQQTPNLRDSKRELDEARKAAGVPSTAEAVEEAKKRLATAEADKTRKAPVKKAPAKVTPIDTAKKAVAAKAAAKAPAKAAPAKKAAPVQKAARVAPVAKGDRKLGKPITMDWSTKTVKDVEHQVATGARHHYRISLGEHGFVAEQKLHAGSWSQMAGRCATIEDAKTLAGWNEAGCTWLAYRDVVGTDFAALVETYGSAK